MAGCRVYIRQPGCEEEGCSDCSYRPAATRWWLIFVVLRGAPFLAESELGRPLHGSPCHNGDPNQPQGAIDPTAPDSQNVLERPSGSCSVFLRKVEVCWCLVPSFCTCCAVWWLASKQVREQAASCSTQTAGPFAATAHHRLQHIALEPVCVFEALRATCSAMLAASESQATLAQPRRIAVGDLVIVYMSHDNMKAVTVAAKGCFNSAVGTFRVAEWVGKPFGSKVFSPQGAWVHLLRPTPELWTQVLRHRTQIIYVADVSQICAGLDLRAGHVVRATPRAHLARRTGMSLDSCVSARVGGRLHTLSEAAAEPGWHKRDVRRRRRCSRAARAADRSQRALHAP